MNPLDTFNETIDFTHLVIASLTQEDYFDVRHLLFSFRITVMGITFGILVMEPLQRILPPHTYNPELIMAPSSPVILQRSK
jgi:hypothetical protein